MLTALAVVREKELGSIINFYVTPVTQLEFLLGKQIPYLTLAMLNYFLMVLVALLIFRVPITGNFFALSLGAFLYCLTATAMGLLTSVFMRSQIAALFATAILTLLPAIQFSGLTNPVTSLDGGGALMGRIFPTTYFITMSRGVFSKALGFGELQLEFLVLGLTYPVLIGATALLLKKQEG